MDKWQQNFLQTSPMFEPLREVGRSIQQLDHWPTLADLNGLLSEDIQTASGAPLQFVAQGPKPASMEDKYEARIYLSGEVQTRTENWHDLFNALVWLAFPKTKSVINARHHEAIVQGVEGNRGKTQDALTLFDESGVVVLYSDESLAELIRDFKWHSLFWERRQEVKQHMKFVIFGHSLYEKALRPYVGFTGKGLFIMVEAKFFELEERAQFKSIDGLIADWFFAVKQISSRNFSPLPILGVPDWWQENEDVSFYANTLYFRPASKREQRL